jgi:hypothetical protein
MSTTRSKDLTGLCSFTFANAHRCRSLRSASHPHLCYYHARKESQARAAEQIGRDVSYFFSGRYLSACDLTAVLARLFSAAASGELKPKTASILAYLAQTLLQTIHLAQHEYINAFGTDAWLDAVCSSVNGNSKYRKPPAPQPSGVAQELPSVFPACPNSASTSVRPCPATASGPTTQLEQPTRTGIVPPGPVILKFIPANFQSHCMTTQLDEPASCSQNYSSRFANLDSRVIIRKPYHPTPQASPALGG